MSLYVNDLSFKQYKGKTLFDNQPSVQQFLELTDQLRKSGVDSFCAPMNLWSLSLSGMPIRNLRGKLNVATFEDTRLRLLLEIQKWEMVDGADDYIFSIDKNGDCSDLMAEAAQKKFQVVSFVFDPRYASNPLKGYIYDNKLQEEDSELSNLYIKTATAFSYIIPAKTKENPEQNPLWNQVETQKYLSNFNLGSWQKLPTDRRRAFNIEVGTAVAEINGWKYSPELSRKNTTVNKLRKVFYSSGFKKKTSYLCIDVRHEGRFELCDREGCHLGEYDWNGHKTGEAQSDHNINV